MSQKKEVIKLTQPWIDNAMDAPSLPIMLDEDGKVVSPFPLSSDAKKSLLELIYNRESGIITRQELMDVLFNEEGKEKGLIIETTI
tara:strand:+ start:304 stop:561 length:258 start_codon:yes stop_codon:yes gene_type:complete